ncbi:gyaR [Scenedesmus sp. PABB004]|nr:gyaR [Scenedesmus sp. PABB004]
MGSLGPAPAADDGGEHDVWEVWWCFDGWHGAADELEALLPPWARLHRMDPRRPLAEQVGGARVLIPTTGEVDAAAIAAPADLRLVAQPAAGFANIDVAAAAARGVPVTTAPGHNDAATAEVALMLMLMLMRRADEARVAFQQRIIGSPIGSELHGKTLGIVGLGRVGRRLQAAAEGLGMRVLATRSGSGRAELEALLRAADVVSLHTQLTAQTQGLIGAAELALMKPRAVLVNTARGPVIDRAALLDALDDGHLGGVGLDVHWVEPADPDDRLYRHPKVLALPHTGAATHEFYRSVAKVLVHNITAVRDGRLGDLQHRLV